MGHTEYDTNADPAYPQGYSQNMNKSFGLNVIRQMQKLLSTKATVSAPEKIN
jgi:hypothetical protein